MPTGITYILGNCNAPSETFIAREIAALRRRGWTIDVVSLNDPAALVPPCSRDRRSRSARTGLVTRVLRHALPLIGSLPRLPLQLLRRVPQMAALAQRVRATGSAGLHAHFAHLPADVALLVAQQTGVPYSCSVHAWDVFAQPRTAIRRRLQPARAVIACSQAAADAVAAAGVDAARIHLVRHGLPLAEFPFAPERAGRRILAVGRLEPKKGFDVLLAACGRIARPNPAQPCEATIIGEGTQRQALEAAIARHRLTGLVTLAGRQPPETVRAAMREAALLVLPSRRLANGDRDGVANVLLEAMALGAPVVTTAAGAAGEVIQDGENGRLVAPDDPDALAAAITTLLDDPAARLRLARAARATIEAQFDEEQTIAALERRLELPLQEAWR
jgi:glycosyltransferase involved in cell wall biosynthesis